MWSTVRDARLKAVEYEKLAAGAGDPETRKYYIQLARDWREMARQREQLARDWREMARQREQLEADLRDLARKEN
jgi:hypothetical protein